MEQRILGRTGRAVSVVGPGHLAARRRLGRRGRARGAGRPGGSRRRPGSRFLDTADVYGDGRSEQLIGRFLASGSARRRFTVATKMGRRVAQDPGALHAGQLPRLDRPVPGQPGRGHARPGAAALPADARLRQRRGVRRTRHAGGRAADRRLRRQRGDLRRGADRDRPAGHGERADHPQRVPAQAAGAGAAGRRGGRCRHHRPGAAGVRAAVRQVRPRHHVRR